MKSLIAIALLAFGLSAQANIPADQSTNQTPVAAPKQTLEKQAQAIYGVCRWNADIRYYCVMTLPSFVGSPCFCPQFANGTVWAQ